MEKSFRWSAFMICFISAHKSQMTFMGLDFEADKPRRNAELRIYIRWIRFCFRQ